MKFFEFIEDKKKIEGKFGELNYSESKDYIFAVYNSHFDVAPRGEYLNPGAAQE